MKLGVVMEGGASRTFFSCGVCEELMKEEIYPDYFAGVSAGIAYGVSYLSKQKGRNKDFTLKYMGTPLYMGMRYLLNPKLKTYYNLDFAFGEVPNRLVPFDYQALAEYPGTIEAVVTNVRTGQAEYKEIPPYETDWKTTIASCSMPVLFPPVKLGNQYYLDGGVSDSVPFQHALNMGCDKLIVILTRPRTFEMKQERSVKLINWIYQKYPAITQALKTRPARYNAASRELLKLEQEGKVFIFAPDEELGIKRTEGAPEKLLPVYEEGLRIGRRDMEALKEYLAK